MSSTVIKVVTFYIKAGVSQEQLLNASSAFTQMLQPEIAGFQKRTLTQRSDSDLYVEMLWWDSMEAAQAALEVDDAALMNQVVEAIEKVVPLPKPRKKKSN